MKLNKNNQGMVHPLMLVLAVIVIAVVGVAVWKVTSNNKDDKSTNNTAATNAVSESDCNKALNDKNICNFAAHYNPNEAYKATDTSTTSDGTGTLTIATDGKGNSQISGTSNGTTFDAITLNSATYLKDASSGVWIKYTASSPPSGATTNPADLLKVSTSDITGHGTITYKNLGTAACGNVTCFKYQIIDTTQPDTTQYVWFDNQNYQLHEYYVKNSQGTNDMTFSYQNVNITAPSPVQDYSATAQ